MCAALAGALIFPLGAVEASQEDLAALRAYARARVADGAGATERAAQDYAIALAASPDDRILAARTLSEAVAAGDFALALKAARILEQSGNATPDARLLILGDAFKRRDWKSAATQIDRIEEDDTFGFMAPILRAWHAVGSNKGNPLALLQAAEANPLAKAYAEEHRPLLLLAEGKEKQGLRELTKVVEQDGARAVRLRIAAAALLARTGDRKEALELLAGDAAPLIAARRLIENRQPVSGEVAASSAGMAEILLRMAIDLHRQEVTPLAIFFARVSSYLAPENSQTWLVTSELLAAQEQHRAALDLLSNVGSTDPFAESLVDLRIRLLTSLDEQEKALALAKTKAQAQDASLGDLVRLGDLYNEIENWDAAAEAYGSAISMAEEADTQRQWTLWLLRGAALEQGNRWPEAKVALEQAYKLAPDEPLVLNYLGYAQLERRENVAEAEKLIQEASRLQPDSPAITDSLGWAYYLQGKLPEAIEALERAVEGEPADPEINEHLGDAYYAAGRRFEARYAWRAALLYAEDEDAERLRAKISTGLTPQLASP